MKYFMLSAAVLTLSFGITASSCKKSSDNATCSAGTGGSTQIVVRATINGVPVINTDGNDTAYVKFGATQFPGYNPASYDAVYAGEEGEDHIHLKGLQCGSYYILRTSYDTLRKRRFTGDAAISFTKTSGEVDTTLVLQ